MKNVLVLIPTGNPLIVIVAVTASRHDETLISYRKLKHKNRPLLLLNAKQPNYRLTFTSYNQPLVSTSRPSALASRRQNKQPADH